MTHEWSKICDYRKIFGNSFYLHDFTLKILNRPVYTFLDKSQTIHYSRVELT